MFFEAMSIVFRFENEDTRDRLIRLSEELGPYEFGTYLANLIEKDFDGEDKNEEIIESPQSTSEQISVEVVNELLSKVQQLLDKGVTAQSTSNSNVKQANAGDLSVMGEIASGIEEIKTTVNVVKKSKKSKLGGLKNSNMNSILSKMNEMNK